MQGAPCAPKPVIATQTDGARGTPYDFRVSRQRRCLMPAYDKTTVISTEGRDLLT